MPGPVVNGVRQSDSRGHQAISTQQNETFLPLVAEGSIRLLLLTSGDLLMARLRQTTDRDGDPAYQLIRPQRVCRAQNLDPAIPERWVLEPFLEGLTQQQSLVPVSYTHLRAHETRHDLVCRLLLEKKNAP